MSNRIKRPRIYYSYICNKEMPCVNPSCKISSLTTRCTRTTDTQYAIKRIFRVWSIKKTEDASFFYCEEQQKRNPISWFTSNILLGFVKVFVYVVNWVIDCEEEEDDF